MPNPMCVAERHHLRMQLIDWLRTGHKLFMKHPMAIQ